MSTRYTCIKCGLATTARHRPENCFKGGYHEWVAEEKGFEHQEQRKKDNPSSGHLQSSAEAGPKAERTARN